MSHPRTFLSLLMLLVAATCVSVRAEDAPASDAPAANATPDDIAQWVKDLDADEYATRQAAQQELEKAGPAAIEAVQQAALGVSQEAAARAIDILRNNFRGEDDAVKQASEAALKKLAAEANPIVAERAQNALKPEAPKPADAPDEARPFAPRGIPFGGRGGIRIEARAIQSIQQIGGGGRSVSIKTVDGNKEIDVVEKDRKIKIVESAEGKITLKVTTEEGDMDGNIEVEADSAEDLKKDHPEAHKIYEEFKQGGGGGARIEFRALPAGPRALPRIRIAPEAPARGAAEEVEKRLKEALERLEEAGGGIEVLPADAADARIKALETIRAQLEKQIEDVRKQTDEAKVEK